MAKYISLFLILCVSGCISLGGKNSNKVDCQSPESKHPRDESLCLVKRLIASKQNAQINKVLDKYAKQKLENSEDYKVALVGGGGSGEALQWAYLVSVNYNNLKVFRSLMVVVNVYASGKSKVKEVISPKEIASWAQ